MLQEKSRPGSPFVLWTALFACLTTPALLPQAGAQIPPDPGCTSTQAWIRQMNPRSDTTGMNNIAYLDYDATYWYMELSGAAGTSATIAGQFPAARYMSLALYAGGDWASPIDDLLDAGINPNPGQNNPFRSGGTSVQGDYTVSVVFGFPPRQKSPNTLYTSGQTTVRLVYRLYAPTNPSDLAGGDTAPVLPAVAAGGSPLSTCALRPIVTPQTATVWGRLDQMNYSGTPPSEPESATFIPSWTLSAGAGSDAPFANQDDNYMLTFLSRQFFAPPYSEQIVVLELLAPTFADTETGVAPYTEADVRYWSICTDDPLTSGVARCIPDYLAPNVNGLATFVISDPGNAPSADALAEWGATWLAWGALEPGDAMYNVSAKELTSADGVFYYNCLFYRQLVSNPAFPQSIGNVSQVAPALQKAAMGKYWPKIGYCTISAFTAEGAGCVH